MATPYDNKKAMESEVHIYAAQANPSRAELELNQADNDAKCIGDAGLRQQMLARIERARFGDFTEPLEGTWRQN